MNARKNFLKFQEDQTRDIVTEEVGIGSGEIHAKKKLTYSLCSIYYLFITQNVFHVFVILHFYSINVLYERKED
jgi:hypothetical protein